MKRLCYSLLIFLVLQLPAETPLQETRENPGKDAEQAIYADLHARWADLASRAEDLETRDLYTKIAGNMKTLKTLRGNLDQGPPHHQSRLHREFNQLRTETWELTERARDGVLRVDPFASFVNMEEPPPPATPAMPATYTTESGFTVWLRLEN